MSIIACSSFGLGCGSSSAPPASSSPEGGSNTEPDAGAEMDSEVTPTHDSGPPPVADWSSLPESGWGAGVPRTSDGKAITFFPAVVNPAVGDWLSDKGTYVAQVYARTDVKGYRVNLLRAFDQPNDAPVVVLDGAAAGDTITLSGGGWTGTIKQGHLVAQNGTKMIDLQRSLRSSPTLGEAAPTGAVVLYDGKQLNEKNLDAWAQKDAKAWLTEKGPALWKPVDGNAVEIVPDSDSIITKQKFSDFKLHLEFRTLGTPTNSGVFLQARYETNINEKYGHFDGNAIGGLDNCTTDELNLRAARPPLEWQTLDIEFHGPKFDASSVKTAGATASIAVNGTKIYENKPLGPVTGAAGRLGEAATGPILLQEHGMEVQFRNIWAVELK